MGIHLTFSKLTSERISRRNKNKMGLKSSSTIFALLLLLSSSLLAQSEVFDISKYGGKPNGDITQALTSAWKDACASATASKIVVPQGTFQMNAVDLKGPCQAPIELQVSGTIHAPVDTKQLKGADQWIKIGYVNSFTLSGGGTFDGNGEAAWKLNDCSKNKHCKMLCMNFGFNFLNDSIVKDVTSKDSKNFHVNVLGCNNFTFERFTIIAPEESLNTDGIHIGRSNGVKILNTKIGTGDDCVSLGDGSKNITVEGVECGPGHGISVGSLGKYPNEEPVTGFYVKNCTLRGTQNGLRIKTWPGTPGTSPVTDMHFEGITMENVSNPVIIDQEYCPWNLCTKGVPSKIKISKVSFKNIRGTSATQEGVLLLCSKGVPCEDVELGDIDLTFNGAAAIAKCDNVKPKVTGKVPACQAP